MNYFTSFSFHCLSRCCILCFCACLHHGSHPMCPLLMASVVIEFDAAHLQPNKRAVCKNPNSPIQYYWYFTGCIIKLNNPLWLEVKWWNSFQWPQLNHKQNTFWCLCIFKVPECNNNCWTWILSFESDVALQASCKCLSVFMRQCSVLWLQ